MRRQIENMIGLPVPKAVGVADAISNKIALEKLGISDSTPAHIAVQKLKAEERRIGSELRSVEEKRKRHKAYIEALDRFQEAWEHATIEAHKNPLGIIDLRKAVRPEFFLPLQDTNKPAPTQEFHRAHWFDFRSVPSSGVDDMIKCGEELVNAGIVHLPFRECVFVLPYITKAGTEIASACLLRQDEKIVAVSALHIYSNAKPCGLYGPEMPPNDPIFYALAILSSRSVERQKRAVSSDKPVDSRYRGDSYFQIVIRDSVSSGQGRKHASPRLHWRRGHLRRRFGRTTWIRPTLVGVAEKGVVVHDYVARLPLPRTGIGETE